MKNINNVAAVLTPDVSLAFYQQQFILNHQMFSQQQQTVIGKVDGLAKMVGNKNQPQRLMELQE